MTWVPEPIDTTGVELPEAIESLVEVLSENAHDRWAVLRLAEGWRYGEERSDKHLTHPDLVPYADLPDSERKYDRELAVNTLKVLLARGYVIRPPGAAESWCKPI